MMNDATKISKRCICFVDVMTFSYSSLQFCFFFLWLLSQPPSAETSSSVLHRSRHPADNNGAGVAHSAWSQSGENFEYHRHPNSTLNVHDRGLAESTHHSGSGSNGSSSSDKASGMSNNSGSGSESRSWTKSTRARPTDGERSTPEPRTDTSSGTMASQNALMTSAHDFTSPVDVNTPGHLFISTGSMTDCMLRYGTINSTASSGRISLKDMWIDPKLLTSARCVVDFKIPSGWFMTVHISNMDWKTLYYNYRIFQYNASHEKLMLKNCAFRTPRPRVTDITVYITPNMSVRFDLMFRPEEQTSPPLPFSLTVTFNSHPEWKGILQVDMVSQLNGSISTPGWDGITTSVLLMDTMVKLTVPKDHCVMVSVFHIHVREAARKVEAERVGPLSKHVLMCHKTSFIGLYENPECDPLSVYCGTLIPGPSAFTLRSGFLFIRFVNTEQLHDGSSILLKNCGSSLLRSAGFKLQFSFHPHSTILTQQADGAWNCSVPQWPEFRHHFPCNLRADCSGREDEVACAYTTPMCGEGRVAAAGRCYIYSIPKLKPAEKHDVKSPDWPDGKELDELSMFPREHDAFLDIPKPPIADGPLKFLVQSVTWSEAEEWCQKEGGHLATVHTNNEITDVVNLFSRTGDFPNVFIGLVPTAASVPPFYKLRWTHIDGIINHFLRLADVAVDNYIIQVFDVEYSKTDAAVLYSKTKTIVKVVRTESKPHSILCDVQPFVSPKTSQSVHGHLSTIPQLPFVSWEWKDKHFVTCPNGHVTHVCWACDVQSACWASDSLSASSSSSSCSAPLTPLPPALTCNNGLQHVSYTVVCDRRPDCLDSSDEDFCVFRPCDVVTEFECGDKSCLPLSKRCDRLVDCSDAIDEQVCQSKPVIVSPMVDCSDAMDEQRCETAPGPPFILFFYKSGQPQILERKTTMTINGRNVNGTLINATLVEVNAIILKHHQLRELRGTIVSGILETAVVKSGTLVYNVAGNGSAVSETLVDATVCGGVLVSSTVTSADRLVCEKLNNVTLRSGTLTCPDTHFQCTDDYCVPVFLRCNEMYDCPGREDEAGCEDGGYSCPGFYRCRGASVCVHQLDLCDGVLHCPQKDDELLCDLTCPDGCTCYGLAFYCPRAAPLTSDPRLRYLDASDSNTNYRDMANNTMLVYLSLVRCNVTGWGPVTLPNLRSLVLTFNNVAEITVQLFHHLPNLRHLTLAHNPLISVFTTELITSSRLILSLQSLDISYVLLTELDVSVLNVFPSLNTLNLTGCGVDNVLGDGFQYLKQLRVLDLRGCPMTYFPKDVFHGLGELRDVHADNYKLCCPANLPSRSYPVNCKAPYDEVSSCEALLRSNLFRIFLYLFVVLSCVGNMSSLVFKLSVVKTKRRTGFDMFVINLCLSDFLMGIYLAIIGVADRSYMGTYLWNDVRWRHSTACKVAGFLSLLSSEVSAFIIGLITLDRFFVLRFPFSQHLRFSSVTACLACAIVWTTCIVIAAVPLLPEMVSWEFYSQTGICVPLPITGTNFKGSGYTFSVMIVLNFVLFVMVAFGQMLVYTSVQKHKLPTIGDDPTTSRKKDRTLARRLITVAVSDFLCWFPIGLLGMLADNGYRISGEVNVAMAIFVLPLNSAINPFLYTLNIMLEKHRLSRERRMRQIWLAQMNAQGTSSGNAARLLSKYTQDEAKKLLNMWLEKGVLSREHVSLSVSVAASTEKTPPQ